MGDDGRAQRLKLLEQSAENKLLSLLRTHGWTVATTQASDSDYIIIKAERAGFEHKVALLYSSATDNAIYRRLDSQVEHIFTKGELYKIEAYAYGIKTPVTPVGDATAVNNLLVQWNETVADGLFMPSNEALPKPSLRQFEFIQSESPIEQIWSRLNHFGSVALAKKLVAERATRASHDATVDDLTSKAEGLAYALRSASDYFRKPAGQSLSQRVLNMYYGSMAFAFAEMIVSPLGPKTLGEIEDMTKQGHGLYSMDGPTGEFSELTVGVIASGFFPRWSKFLGYDVSKYPTKKPKTASDIARSPASMAYSLEQLFGRIPELESLYVDVFNGPPGWLQPIYDSDANVQPRSGKPEDWPAQTFVKFIDSSARCSIQAVTDLEAPLSQITRVISKEHGIRFRALVSHPGHQFCWPVLSVHKSSFIRGAMIAPIFGGVREYRAICLTLLYGLSILVRYRPSVWRRVQEGDWDQYKVLIESFLGVCERILPEHFLGAIVGMPLHAKQPGQW